MLDTLHLVLLAAFVAAASVSMLATVMSLLRVQHVRLTWRPLRSWRDVPTGPTVFLALVALGFAAAAVTGTALRPSVLIGYPAGGVFWWTAAWLARTVAVTEYGLVPDVNRLARAVAWHQVADYFSAEMEGERAVRYVFLYRADDGTRRRLDLVVPADRHAAFAALVDAKLDARFALDVRRAYDRTPHGE